MEIPGYSDLREIGRGGMARVYLARQESLSRNVALKVLNKFDKPTDAQRFLNEAHLIAALDHRNIITIHDIGALGERHYIAMEYLAGGDLEKRLKKPIEVDQALEIVRVIGACLAFVHAQGVIHRDIKPANILFHTDGTPILTDFGIAKHNELDAKLTMDGTAVGSPYYLSPEQAECKPLDGRTDIYGLGVVLYEMLTGQKPFEGSTPMETLVAHITEPAPPLPESLNRFQPLLDRMLAKQADDRFESGAELVEEVARVSSDNLPGPSSISGWTRGRDKDRRKDLPKDRGKDLPRDRGNNSRGARLRRYANFGAVALVMIAIAGYSSIRTFKIESHLQQADHARSEQRLYFPENDNVLYHYQTVLKWDSGNDRAVNGLVEVYVELADKSIANLQYGKARRYIEAGLDLAPEDQTLLELQENAHFFGDAPRRVANGFKSMFGFKDE
jgi:serine/threonine-protein kinase PpkA